MMEYEDDWEDYDEIIIWYYARLSTKRKRVYTSSFLKKPRYSYGPR